MNEQQAYEKAEAAIERIYERNDGDESIGPSVPFDERYSVGQGTLDLVERVASRLTLSDLGSRGFDGDALREAIQAEERLAEALREGVA